MKDLLSARRPWIKICGITRPEDAEVAVALGATALGINFWPRSSRFTTAERAREIVAAVAGRVPVAGVFVDQDPAWIDEIAEATGIDLIQLHGDEPPAMVARFASRLIRALRSIQPRALDRDGSGESGESVGPASALLPGNDAQARSVPSEPSFPALEAFQPADPGRPSDPRPLALLLDGPAGVRFGGTGESWNWSLARRAVELAKVPVFIAGGIRPENVRETFTASGAAGVDVASGVESAPGIKDAEKMERMIAEVRRVET